MKNTFLIQTPAEEKAANARVFRGAGHSHSRKAINIYGSKPYMPARLHCISGRCMHTAAKPSSF